jgi:hypothetical protein
MKADTGQVQNARDTKSNASQCLTRQSVPNACAAVQSAFHTTLTSASWTRTLRKSAVVRVWHHVNDNSWKANANVKLSQLRSAVQLLLRHANLPDLEHAMAVSPGGSSRQTEDSSPANTFFEHAQSGLVVPPPMDMTREATAELEFLNDSGLATVPMKSLYDLTRLRTLSNQRGLH